MEKIKIGILDGDSMMFSAFLPNKVVDEVTGEPQRIDGKFVYVPKTDEEIQKSFDGILYHIFNEGGFTHYILFIKGKNTITDRLAFNPDYKQHRTKEIPEKWEFTKQYAIKRWGATEVNGIEVDDAVRICNINIPDSHIVAIDKDLLWLKGENFNWRKNEWVSVNEYQEEEYLSRSMVVGDSVDGIKGLINKGESFCNKHNIRRIEDAFKVYLIEYGVAKGIDEFYKNFKALYILEKSDKFTELPTPKKIEHNDNGENRKSRSTTRELFNS